MLREVTAYVAVGSNLGDRNALLGFARSQLDATPDTRVLRTSPLYRSAAIGPGRQPDYLNAVFELCTALAAPALLTRLHAIEQAAGRTRTERWAARTLDLDLLLYGSEIRADTGLCLPHPRLQERNFVVWPLHDLAPGLRLPDGTALADLRKSLSAAGLWPYCPDKETSSGTA